MNTDADIDIDALLERYFRTLDYAAWHRAGHPLDGNMALSKGGRSSGKETAGGKESEQSMGSRMPDIYFHVSRKLDAGMRMLYEKAPHQFAAIKQEYTGDGPYLTRRSAFRDAVYRARKFLTEWMKQPLTPSDESA